jgi:hypothetical protein
VATNGKTADKIPRKIKTIRKIKAMKIIAIDVAMITITGIKRIDVPREMGSNLPESEAEIEAIADPAPIANKNTIALETTI